jgi:uncharacterized membrane protein
VHLPFRVLLILGVLIVAGHNLLDGYVTNGSHWTDMLWYTIHQAQFLPITETRIINFGYPVLPWIGVMVLGYCFGYLYQPGTTAEQRFRALMRIGLGAALLFVFIRWINLYGNLTPWSVQKNGVFTLLSFINVTKYPPSLDFVLITLGPALVFLALIEKVKNNITDFLMVFGRVPLFYYFLHIFVIKVIAVVGLLMTGKSWTLMILNNDLFETTVMASYGYPLWIVYLLWALVVMICYPACRWYMQYKATHKAQWWLSYL